MQAMMIHENNKDHLYDFIRLNEEWICKYFSLEPADSELAKNPYSVIENKGYIFSISIENTVVGVCALFNQGNAIFELARMAVSPAHQGKGIGKKLMQTCLSKAHEIEAQKVYLLSNTKLHSAIELYKTSGFTTIRTGQHPVYSRANIVMEKLITQQQSSLRQDT